MGSKKAINLLSELKSRCHPKQLENFKKFADKSHEYKIRLSKYPAKLPNIDFQYYRTHVREDYVKMVDEFEQKYKEMNKIFDERNKIDTSKYYEELEKQREEVEQQVCEYKEASNERIKILEKEIARIKALIPYDQMSMEDFCDLRPEHALPCCNGVPSFWPHLPDEQTPGPADPSAGHGHGDDGKATKPKDSAKKEVEVKAADAKAMEVKKPDSKDDKKSNKKAQPGPDDKNKKK